MHPSNAEVAMYSSFEVISERPDRFIPNKMVRETIGFTCPRCTTVIPGNLDHGGEAKCECGLKFQLFGNGLFYWE